ncbi:hypothetical protein MY3957_003420 [Beauveria namnaoensis]
MLATLETTTTDRADCRAQGTCICQQRDHGRPSFIADKYRICLSGSESARSKHYFHVRCCSGMLDLHALISAARGKA